VSLSVCCLTNVSGARLRAILAPLREAADEIVVAADARTSPEEVEQYRGVADRVLRCEFELLETHLAWLHGECAGDWVLRIDGDELVSPALAAALPELTARRDMRQYWLPRRWLDRSAQGWYDELPWSPDYQNRLVRNDASLRFETRVHSGAVPQFPARYLGEPFYHLLCAVETFDERQLHSLRYELELPSLLAPGGGPLNATFYLPELFARRAPHPLPEEDAMLAKSVPL
jgi:hypothetical protein